ncbi:MAG TPA: tyrosine/phenylalanine carboxypeptidase domain-containing protein [Sphingomicrobium sp.]|nr:tyrosine/phenylalanine carboxypeptidase domain-containing protein [Sphingomicrobium sp.]
MSARPHLAAEGFAPEFGQRGELRQPVGETGRIHLDRWLPFLILNRSSEPANSIARRVAVNSPAYLIWSPQDDDSAERAFAAVAAAMKEHFGSVLVITVTDAGWDPPVEGSQQLPAFDVKLGASAGEGARSALDCLAEAVGKITVDLRQPNVEIVEPRLPPIDFEPPSLRIEHLSIAVPQIHRAGESTFYPQLTHDLSVAIGDALLQAACAFVTDSGIASPSHHRSLGRSAFLAAALDADKKLDRVARSFDFLLSVSPINGREAMERFFASGADEEPEFRYRPLTVDPDVAKRDLYAVDLSILEDPLLQRLLSEKRRELDHQLTMLATRNTPAFKAASLLHYGTAGSRLLEDARAILARPAPARSPGGTIGAPEVASAARALVDKYRALDSRFDPVIEIRDDVGSLLVSGGKLMIPSGTSMLRSRLDALLSHEISVHLLTYYNGASQGLTVFRTGLANYEGLQEGLGVFAEWAVGGLSPARMRLLAGRVIAVDAMLDGAGFVDVYRLLADEHGLAKRSAFDVATRVFRSGGLAKDMIYLKGFQDVIGFVASGASLDPFWIGKIAPDHVGAIEELLLRQLVRPPLFTPLFLERDDVRPRVERLRGQSFAKIFDSE